MLPKMNTLAIQAITCGASKANTYQYQFWKLSRSASRVAASLLLCLGAFAPNARAEDSPWTSDFPAAKAKARAEKKYLLVDFTGTDWCIFCKKLQGEVFDKEYFKKEAPKQFVLVELDYPQKKQLPDELKAQNEKLRKQYKITGYPTLLLLDAEGQVLAQTGYRPGGPEKYMAHLGDLTRTHAGILQMKSDLEKTQGLERAKMLDQLIGAYDKLNNPAGDLQAWSVEIVALDPDNQAGLKNKYECRALVSAAEKLGKQRQYDDAIALLNKALACPGSTAEQKQDIYFTQGKHHLSLKDLPATLAALQKALAAAPEGSNAEEIKNQIVQLTPAVAAQEFVASNLDAAAKAQGLERAGLLDKLLDANAKLDAFRVHKIPAEDVVKWREELVAFDTDNKAGLRKKYEFDAILGQATTLSRAKKYDEGLAAADKALAVSGITPQQIQEGLVTKGSLYFRQNELSKAIECYNKAMATAPESRLAGLINVLKKGVESKLKRTGEKAQK
jgi:thioredoxin-related protein